MFDFEEFTGKLFATMLILGLICWIYILIEGGGQSIYNCPPGTSKISGWSGGSYTVLCISK